MAALKVVSSSKSFGGFQRVYEHQSEVLKCAMKFAIYLPPQVESSRVPVLYWLSGLTCTEQNFIGKAGAQRYAAEHGLAIVAPDTSPRGCGIEGEDDSWDFGTGAGFYVDATEEKWKTNYNMYSYTTRELPTLVSSNFPVIPEKCGIFGHSMGGHGALICALKNPTCINPCLHLLRSATLSTVRGDKKLSQGISAQTGRIGRTGMQQNL